MRAGRVVLTATDLKQCYNQLHKDIKPHEQKGQVLLPGGFHARVGKFDLSESVIGLLATYF